MNGEVSSYSMQRPFSRIVIHTIGAGFGESVVIELPDCSLGIVDPYCGRTVTEEDRDRFHPIIRFVMKDQFKDWPIRFVAITHPHLDHCRGAGHFLQHFSKRINELWVPECFSTSGTRLYLKALRKASRLDPHEEQVYAAPGTLLHEVKAIEEWMEQNENKYRHMNETSNFPVGARSSRVTMQFFAPVSRMTRKHSRAFSPLKEYSRSPELRAGQHCNPFDPSIFPSDINWNDLSMAFLVSWEQVKVLLCGDVETATWNVFSAHQAAASTEQDSWSPNLVKIGHHGSRSGIHESLLSCLGSDTIGVLTPFNRGRTDQRLPSPEGLDPYRSRVRDIYTSSRDACDRVGPWAPPEEHQPDQEEIDAECLTDDVREQMPEDNALQGAFSQSNQGLEAFLSGSNGLPAGVLSSSETAFGFSRSLHPYIRAAVLHRTLPSSTDDEESYRISVYIDSAGNVVKIVKGRRTGKLEQANT